MNEVVFLIIPFIVLVLFGTMVDRLTQFIEGIMKPIPFLPNALSKELAFILLVLVGFGVCWEFDFNLLAYLNHPGRNAYAGYIFTAVLISGGSSYLKTNFENMDALPGILGGLTTTVSRYFKRPNNTSSVVDAPNTPAIQPPRDLMDVANMPIENNK
jgi:hypothetical protein